jgi:fructose-1,6-bisphosphatase/sedoheptulose 1,7-bisphosphatase-like protein
MISHNLSRITIDIPVESHKKLKTIAAILGKSMRELVVEAIDSKIHSEKIPNKETLKTINQIEKRKGLKRAKNAADLFKKLGL